MISQYIEVLPATRDALCAARLCGFISWDTFCEKLSALELKELQEAIADRHKKAELEREVA